MTIKDLYVYAKERGFENFEINIQHSDGGGFYSGTRDLSESDIDLFELDSGGIAIL